MREVSLVLYIAGGTANSCKAERNLAHAVGQVMEPLPAVTIVDLVKEPGRAISAGVLVTPTLTCQYNGHKETIIGTLDDTEALARQIRNWQQE